MDRGDLQREVDQRLQKNGRKRGRGAGPPIIARRGGSPVSSWRPRVP